MQLLAIFAMCAGIVGVLFALQNNVQVTLSFFLWQFEGSLALVFLLAMLLGALIVGLLSTPATLRRQWRGYRKTRQIRDLEAERRQLLAEIEALRRQRQAGATVDVLPEASEKRLALPPHEAV